MEFQDFLALLAQALLIVALPIVIAAAVQHFRVMSQRLRTGKNADRWETVERGVALAVSVLQHTGLADGIIGPEARKRAIQIAQEFLDSRGVKLDVEKLATLIETEFRKQLASPTLPADSPLARQALLQAAVESAVLAAEQSGLAGIIVNTAVDKKNYAMQIARDYLRQYELGVSDDLLGGLIEAQLLRMYLAAHGQMPPSRKPGR